MSLPFPTAQLTQTRTPGREASITNFQSLPCTLLPTSTNTVYGGTAVKLVPSLAGESNYPIVDKAGAADQIYGIVRNNVTINSFSTSSTFLYFDVLYGNSRITMRTGGAITAGSKVEISPQTGQADQIITWGGTNTVIGVAEQGASGAGFIITIKLSL